MTAIGLGLLGLSALAGLVIGRRWAALFPLLYGVGSIVSIYVARDSWSADDTRAGLVGLIAAGVVIAEVGIGAGLALHERRPT